MAGGLLRHQRGGPVLFVSHSIDQLGIAVVHTAFNILCTALLFPFSGLLEKMACRLVPDTKAPEKIQILDERFLATPSVAIDRARRWRRPWRGFPWMP